MKCPEEAHKHMNNLLKLVAPVVGAGALMTSVFSGALASHPPASNKFVVKAAKSYTVNGKLTVTDVLRVNKNQSVYGRQYAHGGLQVWKGMTVTNGGVTADSLSVKGALSAASATLSGNLQTGTLQAGAMNGSTLALTGAATIGGALNAAGRITGNGLDAGTGGLTTTGNVAGAGFSASSITDSGALSAGSVNTSGALSAGSGAFGSLQVAGTVNFTGATITGLNLSNINLSGSTVSSLNIGSSSSSTAPLNLSSNGKTIALGVNGNGALTTDSLAVNTGLTVGGNSTFAGNLALGGSGGLTTSLVTAANASGSSSPGPLGLTGSTITLSGNVQHNGNTTLGQGKDLIFTTGSGAATHVTANGDTDVAGTLSVTPQANVASPGPAVGTVQYNFTEPYASAPIVVVTAAGNPQQGTQVPAVWVTLNVNSSNQYTGFIVHYQVPSTGASPTAVTYHYHVIGS
jgi:hypothetical protein